MDLPCYFKVGYIYYIVGYKFTQILVVESGIVGYKIVAEEW